MAAISNQGNLQPDAFTQNDLNFYLPEYSSASFLSYYFEKLPLEIPDLSDVKVTADIIRAQTSARDAL